jgi:hypothetical protein
VRAQSRQAYRLFMTNPDHPSLRFKELNGPGNYWSVRFGGGYRAVCRRDGEGVVWLWSGRGRISGGCSRSAAHL